MSLRVWLPLNGTLNNQGLDDITVTNNGATVDNSGKIGKCYSFDGSSKITNTLSTSINSSIGTLACWFKMTSLPSSSGFYNLMQLGNLGGYATCRFGVYMEYSNRINVSIDGSSTNSNAYTHSLMTNQWYHLCVTHDGTTVKLYVDGVEVLSKVSTKGSYKTTASYLYVGGTSSYYLKGSMNDVRYYDHALSPKEVEILSQGLVAHYTLDGNGRGEDNIISGTSPNEVQYTYPSSSYSDKFSKVSTIVPSASQYVLSFWAKSTHAGDKVRAHWYSPNTTTKSETNQGISSTSADGNIDFTLSDKWEKYWCIWTQSSTTAVKHFIFPRMFSQSSGGATGTGTVSIKCVKLEEGTIPTPWMPNSADTAYSAMGYDSTTEYDVSGYGYNGTKNGTFSYNSDTARYSVSTKYTGSNYISLTSPSSEVKTVSFWAKWDSIPSRQSILFLDYKSRIGFGLASNGIIPGVYSGSYNTFDKSVIKANTWYHIVIINTGKDYTSTARKLYINGVEQTATSNVNFWTYNINQTQIGKRSTSSDGLTGEMSDVRMYATALSATQVKDLYNTAASVANDGTLFCYELVEV